MKSCPVCHIQVPNDVHYCPNDGTVLRNSKFSWIFSMIAIFLVIFAGFQVILNRSDRTAGGIDTRSSGISQPVVSLDPTSTNRPSTKELNHEETITPTKVISSIKPTNTTSVRQAISGDLSTWKQGQVVYTARNEQGAGLYLLELSTGDVKLLLTGKSENYFLGASTSPNGSKIAYYQYPDQMYVLDLLAQVNPVLTGSCQSPTWLNDNHSILCRYNGNVFNWIGGSSIPEIRGVIPALAPNGQDLTYAKFENDTTKIYLSTIKGSPPTLLAGASSENYAPTWAPSGDTIAYQSNAGSQESEIWLVDRNGENSERITNTSTGSWSRAPSWSPDGEWIAFVSNQAGSIGADFGEIFVVSVTTNELYQITTTGGKVYDWRISWMK